MEKVNLSVEGMSSSSLTPASQKEFSAAKNLFNELHQNGRNYRMYKRRCLKDLELRMLEQEKEMVMKMSGLGNLLKCCGKKQLLS